MRRAVAVSSGGFRIRNLARCWAHSSLTVCSPGCDVLSDDWESMTIKELGAVGGVFHYCHSFPISGNMMGNGQTSLQ